MTTTTTSTDQFHGESLNPMDEEVSGWDDQMDVLNLKECTSYTCKVSYPKVEEVVFLGLFSKIHGYRQLTLHSEKILSSHLEECFENSLQGQFVESEEVIGTTGINPISKIPPPNPVNASAFYQKGEDYIQVRQIC